MKTGLFDLSRTTCVIAGAGGLLGAACADALAAEGAEVIRLDRAFSGTPPEGARIVDLTDEKSVAAFFAGLRVDPGRRWAFVNTAYPRTAEWGKLGFENVSMEEWNRNVEMHLGSAFHFTQESVKFLKRTGGGAILNFGSIYGVYGPDLRIYAGTSIQNPVPYAAIKGGIESLTRYVATVFGGDGIRANTLCPGGIRNGQPQSFVDAYESRTPMKRMGTPADIAGVVAFFVSPAADYVTGQTLMVDGGWGAW